ncbi:DUF6285 domain-containing protein [Pollutimonas harenae]|uniref:DUF6285 domain-containing protein n=1 Tax=Pollutimonas harenae TaxID=657015 RepID=A0A853GTE6_9BURK|nr:DUF6285 domain-containing protein [Pollutimonas harenae]NYT85437.1 hypothetical protein [Pollutimonas harenae]TEA70531.1 hypothetical protein ERD84_07535 [Pollutimonas harenae]
MSNRPHGNELLTVARRVLLDDLLPLLPTDKTYDVLMIANAMAISARELQRQGERDEHGDHAISRFYEQIGVSPAAESTEQALAAQIRSRAIAANHQGQLHALLLSLTRAKLALSNPKYLA